MVYIYTTEYYSDTKKKNEILLIGTTCMDLEGITLSGISQIYHVIPLFTCGISKEINRTKQKQPRRYR